MSAMFGLPGGGGNCGCGSTNFDTSSLSLSLLFRNSRKSSRIFPRGLIQILGKQGQLLCNFSVFNPLIALRSADVSNSGWPVQSLPSPSLSPEMHLPPFLVPSISRIH